MDVLVYGSVNSATLALMALGFTLVYGITRIANFAHGSLYVLSGILAWTLSNRFGLGFAASSLLAVFTVTLFGGLMYRLFLVRVRGMEAAEIIGSLAVGLVIMETLRWMGFRGAQLGLPAFVKGATVVGGVPVDYQRLFIVAVGVVLVGFLWLFTHCTKLGRALQAVAQDEQAAMMLGMDSDRLATISLALGCALAAIAALTIFPLGNVTVDAGYNVLIYAVAECIVGGLGSWPGAVAAALLLGFAQTITDKYVASHYSMVVAMLSIIVTLILRPSGFLGKQKELEERV
jgi:branched-chain amino acid transport system permease protein